MRDSLRTALQGVSEVPQSAELPPEVDRQHAVLVRGRAEYQDVTRLSCVSYDEDSKLYVIEQELPVGSLDTMTLPAPIAELATIRTDRQNPYIRETVAEKDVAFVIGSLIEELLKK